MGFHAAPPKGGGSWPPGYSLLATGLWSEYWWHLQIFVVLAWSRWETVQKEQYIYIYIWQVQEGKNQVSGEEHLSQFWKNNSFDQPTTYIVHHTPASWDLTWNWVWVASLPSYGKSAWSILEWFWKWDGIGQSVVDTARSHILHRWQMPVQRRLLPEGSCRSIPNPYQSLKTWIMPKDYPPGN